MDTVSKTSLAPLKNLKQLCSVTLPELTLTNNLDLRFKNYVCEICLAFLKNVTDLSLIYIL